MGGKKTVRIEIGKLYGRRRGAHGKGKKLLFEKDFPVTKVQFGTSGNSMGKANDIEREAEGEREEQ